MKTLATLKKDLEFDRDLSALIEALKSIAVSQFKILERKIKSFEQLLVTIESFFEFIDLRMVDHPFLNPRDKPQAIIAVTSDSGLLGGLNMQVISAALTELKKIPGKLIVIGERGKSYVRESNIPFVAFSGIKDEERHEQAMQLRDYCIKGVMEGSFGHLKVIYPRPISFTLQRIETCVFLPYAPSIAMQSGVKVPAADIISESKPDDIVEYLVYIWMGQKLFEIFGLSRLAEFAARFVHLEDSSQRLKEADKKTRLEYFRVRHEIIDRNMRELFAARISFG